MDSNNANSTRQIYGNGIFTIDTCNICSEYEVKNAPNLVFHGLRAEYLKTPAEGIIVPQGETDAPHYLRYIGKKKIHLGPLAITGICGKEPDKVWFGFDVSKLKAAHPNQKFINYSTWEELGYHAQSFPPEEEREKRKNLFVPEYVVEPTTEILLEYLDSRVADYLIARKNKDAEKAERFTGKKLDVIILDLALTRKMWDDYVSRLETKCPIHSQK